MSYRDETVFAQGLFQANESVELDAELRVSFPVKQMDISFLVTASQVLVSNPALTHRVINSNCTLRGNILPGKDLNASIIAHWSPVTTFNFTQPLMINGWTKFWIDTLILNAGIVTEGKLVVPAAAGAPYTLCMKIVFHSV